MALTPLNWCGDCRSCPAASCAAVTNHLEPFMRSTACIVATDAHLASFHPGADEAMGLYL